MNKYITFLLLLLSLTACVKDDDEDPGDPDQPLVFASLIAEKSTIAAGESTKITAVATGYKLAYKWSATAGDILGTGKEVVYAVSPCHAGTNKITCTVSDGNNDSQSKEIFIVVHLQVPAEIKVLDIAGEN